MRVFASICFLACLLSFDAVADRGFYGGYGYGYTSPHRDAEFYRMERNVRDLKRQQARQLSQCQSDLRQQQRSYMHLVTRLQGLGADVDSLRSENASLSETSSESAGSGPGPSQAEYDDLEERYETLLSAYRALERQTREAP